MSGALLGFAFTICAALGTGIRTLASDHDDHARQRAGTLLVNISGAFLLGLLSERLGDDNLALAGVALLGSVTTFSSLISQVVTAWDAGERRTALAYLMLSLAGGLTAAWLGMQLGDTL